MFKKKDTCLMDVNYSPESVVERKNLYNREEPCVQKTPNGLVFDPDYGINAFFLNRKRVENERCQKLVKCVERARYLGKA